MLFFVCVVLFYIGVPFPSVLMVRLDESMSCFHFPILGHWQRAPGFGFAADGWIFSSLHKTCLTVLRAVPAGGLATN